jgi:hypothetical protein
MTPRWWLLPIPPADASRFDATRPTGHPSRDQLASVVAALRSARRKQRPEVASAELYDFPVGDVSIAERVISGRRYE